MNYQLITTIKL